MRRDGVQTDEWKFEVGRKMSEECRRVNGDANVNLVTHLRFLL